MTLEEKIELLERERYRVIEEISRSTQRLRDLDDSLELLRSEHKSEDTHED